MLNQFYNDEKTREAVKEFFFEQLDKLALEQVYEGKDTQGVKTAKEAIERSFIELRELYEKKKQVNNVNEAR